MTEELYGDEEEKPIQPKPKTKRKPTPKKKMYVLSVMKNGVAQTDMQTH